MPKVTTIQLLDDYDNQELPSTTKATRVTIGNQSWDALLSDENVKKLKELVGPFVKDAEKVKRPTKTAEASVGGDQGASGAKPAAKRKVNNGAAIRQWAQEQGMPVKDAGKLAKSVTDAYAAAHPEEPATAG